MTTKNEERKTNSVTRITDAALVICVTAGVYSFFDLRLSLLAQAPTFRTGTTLVEFTVVALDNNGNPVTDLTRADLTLTDRGQPREIAFFRFHGGPPAVEATPPPLTPGFVTNRPEYQPEPQRNVTAVVLDMINTAPPDQNGARAQLLRHLNALPANTPVGLFRFTDREPVQVLAPFTSRLELMRARLSAVVAAMRQELVRPGHGGGQIVGADCFPADAGGPVTGASAPSSGGRRSSTMAEGMSIFEEVQSRQLSAINQTIRTSRLDSTLANLEALGNHLAAIPGRKNVVWISSGMPIQLRAVQVNGNTVQGIMNFEPRIRQAAQRLANQGIVIYAVDAKGGCRALDNSTTQGRYGLNDPPQEVFASLDVMADVTGGRVIKHENDLSKGIIAASNDLRGTYTVGFYAADEPDDRWHAIEVSTRRKGISLRHRQGYLSVARTQPQGMSADAWSQLARAPLASSGIRLNGRPTLGPQQVTVLLQIAAADLYFHDRGGQTIADLEIAVVEKAAAGATNVRAQPLEVTINDPAKDHRGAIIPAATTWPLNAETTALRVIVRDRLTGRYGTLEMALDNRRP